MVKYVFVIGGVVSGLGKGISGASLGRLLKDRGLKVTMQKFDPYLNVDPGTLNPIEHGEVFVTEDGLETDLDLGHYERFIDENLGKTANITTGRIYDAILKKERHGDYHGKTVQVVPHVISEIKDRFYQKDDVNIAIIEIGGTVGDIESGPFIEAIRQFILEKGKENCCVLLVTLVPYLNASKEHKSKPTQMTIRTMMGMGLMPDIIICRSDIKIRQEVKDKIALFSNLDPSCVIENIDLPSIYEVPLALEKEGFSELVLNKLRLDAPKADHHQWANMIANMHSCTKQIRIAVTGKYIDLHDAYLSLNEAVKHAAYYYQAEPKIVWVNAEELERNINPDKVYQDIDAIIVPGGFGHRGIEGKIKAIAYARQKKIPFLGICLGMQLSLVEIARNVLGLGQANSSEFDPDTPDPIIALMPDQQQNGNIGGTLRLGAYACKIKDNTLAMWLYGEKVIMERHRHRYEVNNDYRDVLTDHGVVLSGLSLDERIVEMIELEDHPFFIATQAHPEFKSRPDRPHPLFKGLIKAGLDRKRE